MSTPGTPWSHTPVRGGAAKSSQDLLGFGQIGLFKLQVEHDVSSLNVWIDENFLLIINTAETSIRFQRFAFKKQILFLF